MKLDGVLRLVELLERRPAPGKGPFIAIFKDGDDQVEAKMAELAKAKTAARRVICIDLRSVETRK